MFCGAALVAATLLRGARASLTVMKATPWLMHILELS